MKNQRLRKALLDEILNKAPMKGSLREKVLQKMEDEYQRTRDRELLNRIARILILDNSPQQIVKLLNEKMNLSSQEKRELEVHVQEKIEKK